jgi:hypothetical protein
MPQGIVAMPFELKAGISSDIVRQVEYWFSQFIVSTDRSLPWELRRLGPFLFILFGFAFVVPFAVLLLTLPWTTALFCSALLMMFVGVMVLAYRPSFVWVGTKTIMARGAFGRLVQHPVKEPFQVKAHWAALTDWTGLGAVSVRFADGAGVFVPLVVHPETFISKVKKTP